MSPKRNDADAASSNAASSWSSDPSSVADAGSFGGGMDVDVDVEEECRGDSRSSGPHARAEPETETEPGPDEARRGTLASASFNLLSTMVGGGSLSLPLAFAQSGNALVGPLLLLAAASASELCMRRLVDCHIACRRRRRRQRQTQTQTQPQPQRGDDRVTYELIASCALGSVSSSLAVPALRATMALIAVVCFFATVGYAVLLRDLLEPYVDYLLPPAAADGRTGGPTLPRNIAMWLVVLAVTPLCRLTELTALRHVGAVSMCAVLTLALCVAYRSYQCNACSSPHAHTRHDDSWIDYLTYLPPTLTSVVSAIPIYISCFICHYNIPPVCNELRNPTRRRCYAVVRATVWPAFAFYALIAFSGSMYGNCTHTGTVHGNVLLDFDEDDPLLLIGRTALACTVTLAFPMLVIPPRDIVLRMWAVRSATALDAQDERVATVGENDHDDHDDDGQNNDISPSRARARPRAGARARRPPPPNMFPPQVQATHSSLTTSSSLAVTAAAATLPLTEPLLVNDHHADMDMYNDTTTTTTTTTTPATVAATATAAAASHAPPSSPTFILLTAVLIFWSATSLACCVQSIDIVWDLLGSSLSIFLGFLIPCGSYLLLFGNNVNHDYDEEEEETVLKRREERQRMRRSGRRMVGEGMNGEEGTCDERNAEEPEEEEEEEEEWDGASQSQSQSNESFNQNEVVVEEEEEQRTLIMPTVSTKAKIRGARVVVSVFVPLMVMCTANAFYRTFLC